jgi:general secretion pathway protein C
MLSLPQLQLRDKLPLAVSVLLGVAIVADAAGLIVRSWRGFVPEGSESSVHVADVPSLRAMDPHPIVEAHLFGHHVETPTKVAAPDTEVALTLTGTLASTHPLRGFAIIVDPADGSGHLWRVGEQIRADIKLQEVYPDRVILERGGSLETLSLPKNRLGVAFAARGTPDKPEESAAVPVPTNAPVTDAPREFSQARHWFAGLSPQRVVDDGHFEGIRLHPMQRYKRQYGLQDGDVLKAINGVSLATPEDADRQLQYTRGQSVSMAIERNGIVENVRVELNAAPVAQD